MKKYYLGTLAILMLTGCASQIHMLDKKGSVPFVDGKLVHDRGDGNLLVLEAPNRRYEARGFTVERHTNLAALYKRYHRIDHKHWDRIGSGLDADHVMYFIETVAKSVEGQEIFCRVMWSRAVKPSGVCTDPAETAFQVYFE